MAKAGRFAARNATASEEAPTTKISISVVAPAFISTRNESPADAELADELSCSFQCDSWAQEEETAAMDADMASAQTRFMVTPGRTGAAPAGGVITDPECGKRGTRAPCRLRTMRYSTSTAIRTVREPLVANQQTASLTGSNSST